MMLLEPVHHAHDVHHDGHLEDAYDDGSGDGGNLADVVIGIIFTFMNIITLRTTASVVSSMILLRVASRVVSSLCAFPAYVEGRVSRLFAASVRMSILQERTTCYTTKLCDSKNDW